MGTMVPANDIRLAQLEQYSIIERVCSVLSLIGSIFIITTFTYSKMFHKPINRLVFFASFGNMMTNVGTLMARTYVTDPNGAGCQFQAFLIQMFLPADTLWTLAMAVNVYLTFYYKFDAAKLRKMEIPYLVVCYGLPFVVAMTYVFIQSPERGRMYGDATLWCWISPRWDIWRLTTFYGPIWVIILVTFFIYIRAGGEIYRKHQQLRNFHSSMRSHHEPEPLPPMDDPLISSKTTEVFITSEAVPYTSAGGGIDLTPLGRRTPPENTQQASAAIPGPAYTVQISSSGTNENDRRSSLPSDLASIQPAARAALTRPQTRGAAAVPQRNRANQDATNAAWSYTKCALLFFTAMLVTWIPSSANRVYSVIHVNNVNLTLEYMSAFVLPLQGFWNAVIYIMTSWKACKLVFHDMFLARMPVTELIDYRATGPNARHRRHHVGNAEAGESVCHSRNTSDSPDGSSNIRPSDKNYENESMTDLTSRPSLHEPGQELKPYRGV